MRQLDLFGSFFDTPPQENKPAETVNSKNPEKILMSNENPHPSYSRNGLRSERGEVGIVAVNGIDEAEPDPRTKAAEIDTRSPILLSLFDALPVALEDEVGIQEVEIAVPETEAEVPVFKEPIGQYETSTDLPTGPIEAEAFIIEEQPVISSATTDEPVIAVKKKVTSTRTKKQLIPELQTNGSVIFDDGKISVKIKNKSPFPQPIVKEKKEKVKRLPQKRGRKSFKEIDAEVDLIDIPEDETLFQKQYYAISEVAKWFRVNTSLLRFWENEFDVLKPRKNRKGDRLFRPEDVKNLQLIYQLLRQRKYTIEGAKEYIKTNKKKADIQLQLTNTLQKFKSFLLDMKANLQQ